MKLIINKYIPFLLTPFLALFLVETGWERYQLLPLRSFTQELLPMFYRHQERVVIHAKVLSAQESKSYFGHDLISREIQPIHITIQNNTANTYSLCPSSVDLPSVAPKKIAFKVMSSAIPRAIAYRIASLLFWPFTIASTIDSFRVMSHYKHLKKDLIAKSMRKEVVAPYSTFERVIFVPKQKVQKTFTVTLIELESLKQESSLVTTEEHKKLARRPLKKTT